MMQLRGILDSLSDEDFQRAGGGETWPHTVSCNHHTFEQISVFDLVLIGTAAPWWCDFG